MACDKNINEILNIDFAVDPNDELNWVNGSGNPIQTVSGQLVFKPDTALSEFKRTLGPLDPTNNRIRLRVNMDLYRPQASPDSTICLVFGIYDGATLIDDFRVYVDSMASGETVEYNLDREYYYTGLSGPISLQVNVPEGYNNEFRLDYLIAEDFNFCDDDVRTYFIINDLLDESFNSVASGIDLLEWKVDGVETLTPDFFAQNTPGGDPSADWKFAKADIDGSDRNANTTDFNTFNPFASEWGLTFENVAGNFHGGKPTGTTSGDSYGAGILTIGFEKPEILNGILDSKAGAFFIDIDYTKSLRVVFDVIINNTNSDIYDSPATFRRYHIIWDVDNCQKQFFYTNQNLAEEVEIPDINPDGFLQGITGGQGSVTAIDCADSFAYSGNPGNFEIEIDFGTGTGEAGIAYNAFDVPDKFEIEWNGNIFSSGYVGHSDYDNDLINAGIAPSEINTGDPSTGSGALLFDKDQAQPQIGILRIYSPLENSDWNIDGKCAGGGGPSASLVEVAVGACGGIIPTQWTDVYIDHPGSPLTYIPENGDTIFTDPGLTTPYNGSDQLHRMRVSDPPQQVVLDYEFQVSPTGVISAVSICSANPPSIVLGAPQCRISGNCGDNAQCSIRFGVNTDNAPQGSTVDVIKTGGTADVVISNSDPENALLDYTEPDGFGVVNYTLQLKNSFGTVIATSSGTIQHQSFYQQLPLCES